MMKVWAPLAAMSTGTFAVPVGRFVLGSVVWKRKSAEIAVAGAMLAATAVSTLVLSRVTKAVAVSLTFTERLKGKIAASSGPTWGGIGPQPATNAKSNTCPLAPLTLVPACTHVPVGLMASEGIVLAVRPTPNRVQLSPPFLVLNTPLLTWPRRGRRVAGDPSRGR